MGNRRHVGRRNLLREERRPIDGAEKRWARAAAAAAAAAEALGGSLASSAASSADAPAPTGTSSRALVLAHPAVHLRLVGAANAGTPESSSKASMPSDHQSTAKP